MPQIKYRRIDNDLDYKYECTEDYTYYSKRYQRYVTVNAGELSDGASGAWDIPTDAWWIHDVLCKTGQWDCGVKLSNWDASTVLGDILWFDGFHFRSVYWWWATFLFGGGKCRENGLWRVRESETN